ncbi:MAG: hypothetical protein HW403_277 [Dehalococcoidia bacterium]|nr:hypothetical protein [Dehalococcoidia bacterium]
MNERQKKVVFIALFAVIGFAFQQVPISGLAGAKVSFTLFDLFGPVAGAFLGGPAGILAVFLVTFTNFGLNGFPLEAGPIVRLFPTLFAVWYFSLSPREARDTKILLVPLVAMLVFWANPMGRQVWYYALFWTIPVLAFFKRDTLLLRSLGSTFTAHAVGGAAWVWVFNMPASVWQNLVPIVAMERLILTIGISLSFVVMTNALALLTEKKLIPTGLNIENSYRFLHS